MAQDLRSSVVSMKGCWKFQGVTHDSVTPFSFSGRVQDGFSEYLSCGVLHPLKGSGAVLASDAAGRCQIHRDLTKARSSPAIGSRCCRASR
jgi:hypothetical protein